MQEELWNLGKEELMGEVQKIYFRNEDNLYTVAGVSTEEGRVTVLGYFPLLLTGKRYTFSGEWTSHPKYGEQFKAQLAAEIIPTTKEGIKAYLGGGLIPGVGEKLAGRLVAYFEEETLQVINDDPQRLEEVPGIGKKTADKIAAAVEANREVEQVMVFLQSHGITANLAMKIYRQYGQDALRVVQENPYRLTEDIFGVGFITADRIARHLGMFFHDPFRLQAGVRHALTDACYQRGHCFLPEEELLDAGLTLVNGPEVEEAIDREEVLAALDELVGKGELIRDGDSIYPTPLYRAEAGIAGGLQRLIGLQYDVDREKLHKAVNKVEGELGFTLAPQQREVIHQAGRNGILVVTGGPGTGKSTVVSGIIRAFYQLDPKTKILLAAPTGRAAKRLGELTGLEAKTLHRLLGFKWQGGRGEFEVNEEKPLEGDLLVVDEFSMVDLLLANHLFRSLPVGMRLVLVGDVDQLPSVGPGYVLRDLIESQRIPTVRLSHIFRQAEASNIVTNAHRINQGKMIEAKEQGDFTFLATEDPEKALLTIQRIIRRALESIDLEEVQVIAPMHNHLLGVENLNKILQEEINPPSPGKKEYTAAGTVFRVGDKVMVIKNNYDKGVFNGNLGRVVDILLAKDHEDLKGDTILVDIDGEIISYSRSEMDELTLAYAITVHKSQGSEFSFCLIPLSTQHWFMLQRNLFYTAVTRGKKMVVLVGSRRALFRAIRNNTVQKRFTRLKERLQAWQGEGFPQ